jgi:hypothetical protein
MGSVWRGAARSGRGKAGIFDFTVMAGSGEAWLGAAWSGTVRFGEAGFGPARQGRDFLK